MYNGTERNRLDHSVIAKLDRESSHKMESSNPCKGGKKFFLLHCGRSDSLLKPYIICTY